MNNQNNNNKGGYIALPPADVLKMMILERRSEVISEIRAYYQRHLNGSRSPEHHLIAQVRALWFEIESAYYRDNSKEAESIQSLLWESDSPASDSIQAFRIINLWLDRKSITRVDLKKDIDRSRVEEENEDKDL